MIDGIQVDKVEAHDYQRRFKLARMLMLYIKHDQDLQDQNTYQKLAKLEEDLEELEDIAEKQNRAKRTKSYDANLNLDQVQNRFQTLMPLIQQKKGQFEGELLKRWTSVLSIKSKNDEKSQKNKQESLASNKNLMHLSSELLKKERLSKLNLINHKKKITQMAEALQQKIKTQMQQTSIKLNQAKQLINDCHQLLNTSVNKYEEFLNKSKASLNHQYDNLRRDLEQKWQHEQRERVKSNQQIRELIRQIKRRNK